MAADNTSAPLTVEAAQQAFAQRSTPQEHEPTDETAVEADATPSPEDPPADAEGTGDAEPQEQATDGFTVLEDGKERKVTADEARNGYLRQQDYTRKTQATADARKAAETEATQYREQRTQYADGLTQLRKALEATLPPEPTEQLDGETPGDFALRRLQYKDRMETIRAAHAEEQRIGREQAAEAQQQQITRLQSEEQKLLELVPEWKDPAKGRAALETLRDYTRERGFTDTELPVIFGDHRSILLVRDALRYRDLMARKPDLKKQVEQVKTAPAGSPKTPLPGADAKRALDTLKKSGRVNDAAAAFLARDTRKP